MSKDTCAALAASPNAAPAIGHGDRDQAREPALRHGVDLGPAGIARGEAVVGLRAGQLVFGERAAGQHAADEAGARRRAGGLEAGRLLLVEHGHGDDVGLAGSDGSPSGSGKAGMLPSLRSANCFHACTSWGIQRQRVRVLPLADAEVVVAARLRQCDRVDCRPPARGTSCGTRSAWCRRSSRRRGRGRCSRRT